MGDEDDYEEDFEVMPYTNQPLRGLRRCPGGRFTFGPRCRTMTTISRKTRRRRRRRSRPSHHRPNRSDLASRPPMSTLTSWPSCRLSTRRTGARLNIHGCADAQSHELCNCTRGVTSAVRTEHNHDSARPTGIADERGTAAQRRRVRAAQRAANAHPRGSHASHSVSHHRLHSGCTGCTCISMQTTHPDATCSVGL